MSRRWVVLDGSWPAVDGGAVCGEVLAHAGQRSLEVVTAQLGGEVRVAHAEAEHEAPLGRLRQGPGAHAGRLRIAAPDVHDAGAENQARRLAGQHAEERERLAADGLGHPQAAVAELLDAPRVGACIGRRERVEMSPDADAPEVRGGHPRNATRWNPIRIDSA